MRWLGSEIDGQVLTGISRCSTEPRGGPSIHGNIARAFARSCVNGYDPHIWKVPSGARAMPFASECKECILGHGAHIGVAIFGSLGGDRARVRINAWGEGVLCHEQRNAEDTCLEMATRVGSVTAESTPLQTLSVGLLMGDGGSPVVLGVSKSSWVETICLNVFGFKQAWGLYPMTLGEWADRMGTSAPLMGHDCTIKVRW